MDLAKVKAKYGHRICLVGNVDCGALLSHGTTAQVEQAVTDFLAATAAHRGGYSLSSSNRIHSSVNPVHHLALIRAAQRLGRAAVTNRS